MSFLKYHLPLIIYAGVIFVLSSIPSLSISPLNFTFRDKLIHFMEFSILGVFLWRSINRWNLKITRRWLILLAIVIGVIYAASDEYHQGFVPGRNADVMDWAADIVGLSAGILLAYKIKKRYEV